MKKQDKNKVLVQARVSRLQQPRAFSLMQFAGGAGGASLGVNECDIKWAHCEVSE